MKKGLAALVLFAFSAVLLNSYSGIMNRKLVEVKGSLSHDTRASVPTSLIHATSHASHDIVQTGPTDGRTTASNLQTTQVKTTITAIQSTGESTWSASPTTLTEVTTEVPQDSTQTTTTVNEDTATPPGSSTTVPCSEWSSTPITQMTTATQTTTAMNPDTSSPPGSSSTMPPTEWSSTPITQMTTATQTTTTMNPDTSSPPGSSSTVPPTEWSSTPITQMTTATQTTTAMNPDTSSPPGSSSTMPPTEWSSTPITQMTTATQTTTTMNPDTSSPPGSSSTMSPTEWSSTPITKMTRAPQTTTAMNPDTSPPGSSSTMSPTEWSSIPITQMTTGAQSTVSQATLGTVSTMAPPGNQTSLITPWTTAPAKGKTTQEATTMHNATASSTKTTMRPTLIPQPSRPQTGTYLVYNGSRVCLKAEMGVQLLIQDKKTYFSSRARFNLDPNMTQASGNCGPQKSNLLLTFPSGLVNLTFVKVEQSYHIETVEASLTISSPAKVYSGLKGGLTMFETKVGHSFKCISEQSVELSPHLQLHTIDVQLQAFDFDGEHFGNADECFSDKNRRAIPVALGLSIAVLLGVLLTACLVARKQPGRGYERI